MVRQQKEEPSRAETLENLLPSCDRTSIIFTLKHQVGALARALQVFQELGINVLHIELHSGNESETVKSQVRSHLVISIDFKGIFTNAFGSISLKDYE